MPTNISVIHAHDFLRATSEGELDFETSRELLIEIVSKASGLRNYEVLLDTRKATVLMSITDLWYLAVELLKQRKSFSRKVAILCPIEQFDHAGFFALCSGSNVEAFTSFEAAIDWLTVMTPEPENQRK